MFFLEVIIGCFLEITQKNHLYLYLFFQRIVATISVGYVLGCPPFPFTVEYIVEGTKGITRYYKTNCG